MARKTGGNIKDLLFERTTGAFAFLVLFLAVLLFGVLLRESIPALRKFGAAFLVTGTWDPVLERFGALPFIYGTIVSSFLAILIAVPLSVGAAIFINEYAPAWMKTPVSFLAELLAAIPSVIYGLWGIFVLVPVLVILPLFLIFFDLLIKGAKELKWTLLIDLPHPVGEPGGGIANGIVGTLVITLMTMLWSVPTAVLCGIYLAEYGRGKFASAVRFAADTMTGVPSIIMGIFGYILLVLPMKRFSAWAGAAALSMIFIPAVVRTTEEMLRTVPMTVREAALALGIARWKATLRIT